MSHHHKIISYVPRSIHINTFYNHKDFLRKRPSKMIQIKIAETLKSYTFPSLPGHSYPTKLIRLLKRIKGLKRLSFDQYMLSNCGFNLSYMISLIKRTRRIQGLTINDLWIPLTGQFKTRLDLWMKYLYHLQTMLFKLQGSMALLAYEKSLPNALKVFLKSLRRQNYMKSLTIQLPERVSITTPVLLQSSRYPKSLQKLQLLSKEKEHKPSNVKLPCLSLSSFKQLETFALQITNDHIVISQIMDDLPSLQHLRSLTILLPNSFVVSQESSFFGTDHYTLDSQVFSKLTHLSIKIPQEWTQTSLLERLNLSNLQSLQLSLYLVFLEEHQRAALNLSKMKQLKALKLSITYFKQLNDVMELFFESIVGMELLTSFRINFACSSFLAPREELSSNTLSILERIFQKPAKIQDFSLECIKLMLDHEFPRLIQIFRSSASNFKRFKLDTDSFALEQENIGPLVRFVEGLENIRALKLPCFEINTSQFLTRITSGIVKLKEIRSVSLGRIGGEKVEEQVYLESLERMTQKRGLESFKWEITDDLKNRLREIGAPLSLKNITEKNSFLKFASWHLLTVMNRDIDF